MSLMGMHGERFMNWSDKSKLRILIEVLAGVIILAVGLLLSKSLQNKTVDQNTQIVIVFKSLSIKETMGFWDTVRAGINVAAKEFGVTTEIVGAEYERDIEGQISAVEEAINKNPAAIILAATDYNKLVPVSEKVKNTGIKLITIDSGLSSDISESFIATDNIQAGIKAGTELSKLVDSDAEIAIMSHLRGTATAIDREKGVRQGLIQSGINNIGETLFCDNSQERSYEIIKQLLKDQPQISGIACLNETSSLGAAKAVDELGLSGTVKLVGFDGTGSIEEVKYIERGVMQATVLQNPFNMGYKGVEMAVKAILGEKIDKIIDTGSTVITRENMYNTENEQLLFPFVN